jgi:alpha-beta hydrolase superfamily lysophospholipase
MTRRSVLASVAAVAVLVLVAACSGGDDSDGDGDSQSSETTAASTAPAHPEPEELATGAAGFYDVPDPLPTGEHGDLVRYQVVANPPAGVVWYRVMYLSETLTGDPTVVTGVVTVPDGAPPAGGWGLVTHAHGSTGIDDPCAPSVSLDGDRSSAIEIALLSNLAPTQGYVVASTDYEGLGGPGRHPFLVGESEGRSVLDIAVAARQVPGVEVRPETAIAGYSQGGHAALWAHQIAPEWAPDLDILGTMAGAPATELATSGGSLPAELRQPFWVTVVAGFAAAYPDVDAADILTPAGLDLVDQLDGSCLEATMNLDPNVPLLQAEPNATEPWSTLLQENTPGREAAPSPVLVIHSAEDRNVPIEGSATLLDRQCAAGQVVERRVLPTGDHVAAAVPAYQQAFEWFTALSAGTEPVSSCP